MTANAIVRARRRSVALAAMTALACSTPALAQTRLYLLTGGDQDQYCTATRCDHGRLIDIDVETGRIAATEIKHARNRGIGPVVTPDGRYLLWSGSELPTIGWWDYGPKELFVSLYDLAGQRQFTPLAVDDNLDYAPLAVHPSEMRAWVQLTAGAPIRVEPGHTQALQQAPCADPVFESRSGDGRRLSYLCDQPRRVVVVDSADGRPLATVALGPHPYVSGVSYHLLDHSGTTLYVVDWDNAYDGDLAVFRRFDVATGAVLAERTGTELVVFLWAYDETAGQLWVGGWNGVAVLDANTLAEIGRIASPYPTQQPKLTLDPHLPHAYIAWRRDIVGPIRVSIVHTGTLATLASIDIPVDGDVVGIALGPRPPRVSELTILVDDQLATLTWATDTTHSIATEQVVEVGFAPGQTVARLAVAAGATSTTVPGVPPGRYYVRVRSVNGTGLGTPSNEVLVEVP